jgi:Polysaccharide deacetylase
MNSAHRMSETQKAVFTVSIDFELMWGTADRPYAADFRSLCEVERREVVDRLLGLLQEYGIPATWGVVGHLFLLPSEKSKLARAASASKAPAELYHGADLLERVRRCTVKQDIGSHTFCHVEMDPSKCSRWTAEQEVEECVRQARKWGLEMKSFIFPRNLVGHLDVLKRHGFTCYRGPEPHWYAQKSRMVRRMGHLFEIVAVKTPPSVMVREEGGICNIPGSMLYTPSFGARRYLPVWMRVLRAKRGMDNAVRRNEIFHLWFHPTDLAGLRRIFDYAARLRESGRLVVRPMCDLVPASASAASEREVEVVA